MQTGTVNTSIENGIATVSFFHPQSNSLPGVLLRNLATTFSEIGSNKEVKVIVLRSEGEKAFCAGASFDELMAIKTFEEGKEFFSGFALVINAMRTVPQFIVARVHSKAVGGGVGIASSVDYCFATSSASIKLSELAVGIGPFVVGPAVERKMGVSAMSHLAINATEWQSAQWAKEKGLYNDVFETEAALDFAVNSLAQKLASSNPAAMHEMKKTFWRGTENWDVLLAERAAISGKLVLSDFTRSAIEKFKKK